MTTIGQPERATQNRVLAFATSWGGSVTARGIPDRTLVKTPDRIGQATPQVAPQVAGRKPAENRKAPVETPVENGEATVETPVKTPDKIIELFRANPQLTLAEVAEELGMSRRAVERATAKLVRGERLRFLGPRKSGHWETLE